jgi:predicted MPP superfamily phosphohydrolase
VPLWLRVAFGVLYWLAACGMFVSFGLRRVAMPEFLHRVLHVVGTSWLLFTLYMAAALLIADLAHWIWPSFHHGVWYALCLTVAVLAAGYINYRHFYVEHVTIETDKPIEGGCLRLVAISDVHLGRGTTRSDLARYVEKINSENPDIVVIVGDLIDNSILPVAKADMCREFERVKARYGIYMAAGNHEYISGIEACRNYLKTTSIQLLSDSVAKPLNGVEIVCRDDRQNLRRAKLDSLLADCSEGSFKVVLDHQPNAIAESQKNNIDLHLSGHTHRGQIFPLNLLTDHIFEQSHGYRKWGDTHAYVMTGLSLWGPPFRIGTHSELLVVDIVSSCSCVE